MTDTLPPIRAAIYARLARHNTLGIARQIAACQQHADARGYQVIDTYADNGIAATGAHRPALADMLANIGQYGVIIVWHLDRLARRSEDMERIIAIAEDRGTIIESTSGASTDDVALTFFDGRDFR